MEIVLIDTFIVPEESKAKFLEAYERTAKILKTLPGFVEGYIYEKRDGDSKYNFLTTAVWKDDEAFKNAKQAISAEYQKLGINPKEIVEKLNIKQIRSIYERSAY